MPNPLYRNNGGNGSSEFFTTPIPENIWSSILPDAPVEETEPMTRSIHPYVQYTYCNSEGLPDAYTSWEDYLTWNIESLNRATQNHYRRNYEARIRECNDVINGLAVFNKYTYLYTFSWMGPEDYVDATAYNSNGFEPEWFHNWTSYLEDLERNTTAWSRLEDRLREANEVISQTYIKFDPLTHRYIWTWMQPVTTKPTRSLLTVVKYIKKNRKTLKETSRCWKWLEDCKQQYFRKNRMSSGMELISSKQLLIRFLNGINKYINDPAFVIEIYSSRSGTQAFLFTKFLVPYYTHPNEWEDFFGPNKRPFTKTYITKANADLLLRNNLGILDNDKYYSNRCVILIYNTSGLPKKEIADNTKHAQCTSCQTIWYKENITFNSTLDDLVCPSCASKKNEDHTLESVHGGYHSHRGDWKFFIRRKKNEQTIPMGIEIEMASRNNTPMATQAMQLYNAQREINKDWHEVYFERDGSIGDNGIECVSNPMTLEFAKEYWEKILPIFRAKFIGWRTKAIRNTDAASYGIHLTVHRKYFSNLQLARTVKFFNDNTNQDFLKAIAQRDYLYGNEGWAIHKKPNLTLCSIMHDKGKITQTQGKYTAVNVKSNGLVEFRMFASTLNQESFMKNYEFLDSFWHWVKETSWSVNWKDYIQWLAVQKQTVKRWPNLVTYIYRDSFYIKNSNTTAYKADNKILPVFKKLNLNKILMLPTSTTVTPPEVLTMDTDSCA